MEKLTVRVTATRLCSSDLLEPIARRHFGRNDGFDQWTEGRTVNDASRHSTLDYLNVVVQIRQMLNVAARNEHAIAAALRQRNVWRPDNGDSTPAEPLVTPVYVCDVLVNRFGDYILGGVNRSARRDHLRAENIDPRILDPVESCVEGKLVEGFQVDGRSRAHGRGDHDAHEHRQQQLPIVDDAPHDYPCQR